MKNKITNHHIRARSKGGTNNPNNIFRLKNLEHNKFHQVFTNETLQEQMYRLFTISYTAISDEIKDDMIHIITASDEYVYNKGIIKPKYMK